MTRAKVLRILFAVNIPYPEGRANTRRIRSVARELAVQGHRVEILLPVAREPRSSTSMIEGVRVNWCLTPSWGAQFLNESGRLRIPVLLLSRLVWLRRLLRMTLQDEYDWLYLYQPGLDGLIAAAIARCLRRRVCSEYVDLLGAPAATGVFWRTVYWTQLLADRLVPHLSHVVLVISTGLRELYARRIQEGKIYLVPTLVSTQRFGHGDPTLTRRSLGLVGRPIVCFAGSFVSTEGLAVLFRAFAEVVIHVPNAVLVIAGGSLIPGSDDPLALTARYSLPPHSVRCLGQLPENDVISLLGTADILVMPKLDVPVNHFGLGTKFAEYLASGRAVIASRVGDVPLYAKAGHDAILVEPGDWQVLTESILALLASPAVRASLGRHGRLVAEENFDVRCVAARIANILQRIDAAVEPAPRSGVRA